MAPVDPAGDLEKGSASSSTVVDRPGARASDGPVHERVDQAVERVQEYLLGIQNEDGHWRGELEGDTILESEYALLMAFLGRLDDPDVVKAGEYLRRTQLETGGWTHYPGGPTEVSGSVKAYFVLKLLGDDPDAPHMARARKAILEAGGVEAANSFTKIYLAIFGQYPWSRCPAVPPEMILLPESAPFNLHRMSSWSRTIVVPLSIIWAHKPRCEVPGHAAIPELFVDGPPTAAQYDVRDGSEGLEGQLWTAFFSGVDLVLKGVEATGFRPLRRRALEVAERWILDRLEKSDGLGAIFPPIVNTIFALRCLGYPGDHPVVEQQLAELRKLEIEEDGAVRLQPCMSPVWDTAYSMYALRTSGLAADHPALLKGARWLLDREVRHAGDWAASAPGVEPGGWYFEYANEFYPDLDDTTKVLTVLHDIRFRDPDEEERRRAAIRRGLAWMLAMQNDDGGWAAFDKGCDVEAFVHVPFADHNAMIDPSCDDITGRALETMALLGHRPEEPHVARAAAYLKSRREPDGTWYGRWGCNYLYGTWLAVTGLVRSGEPRDSEWIQAGARWVRRHQNSDGGWGELPRSYDDPSTKGQGPSTAAQTAWALLTLFAAGDADSLSVHRGIRYLLETQLPDGSWYDEPWTGTGFPRVFYLRYHLYATYFPLVALGNFRRLVNVTAGAGDESVHKLGDVQS